MKQPTWDEAKRREEANRQAERDAERDDLLRKIGAATILFHDPYIDTCVHCLSEADAEDCDPGCPRPLIDQFTESGYTVPSKEAS